MFVYQENKLFKRCKNAAFFIIISEVFTAIVESVDLFYWSDPLFTVIDILIVIGLVISYNNMTRMMLIYHNKRYQEIKKQI